MERNKPFNERTILGKINYVTAMVLIVTAILFALISILAVWEVFGADGGEVVWKALVSLGTIALAALVVNVAAKLIDNKQQDGHNNEPPKPPAQ